MHNNWYCVCLLSVLAYSHLSLQEVSKSVSVSEEAANIVPTARPR